METSMNIIDSIKKSDLKNKIDLYEKLLNCFINFTQYIKKIFDTEISKDNEFSKIYKQFKEGKNELSCVIKNKQHV